MDTVMFFFILPVILAMWAALISGIVYGLYSAFVFFHSQSHKSGGKH